jgi:hypothetical protein
MYIGIGQKQEPFAMIWNPFPNPDFSLETHSGEYFMVQWTAIKWNDRFVKYFMIHVNANERKIGWST